MSSRSLSTAILAASTMLTACGASMQLSPAEPPGPKPLVVASCPELVPLNDPGFGATTLKLIEVAGVYRECRAAALGQ